MGRIFVIVGGFLVLLLTTALVVPPFIDWTGYRAEFEREASRIIGRDVHVRGAANARLLPFPSVTFSDVYVGGVHDTTRLSIENFSINVELMPFLRGEVLIFDMQVEQPVLQIGLDENGRVDWKRNEDALLNNAQVKVEKLTVSNGRIQITDKRNGRDYQLQNINAVLSARNITGPWQMNGSLDSEGQKIALDLSTGELKSDGSLRVRSRIMPEKIAATFETDGDVTLQDGLLNYTGSFNFRTAETQSKKAVAKAENSENAKGDRVQNLKASLLTDLRIHGLFTATDQQFLTNEFRMEQGSADDPYVVNGKAQFVFDDNPRFEISADGQQFFVGGGGAEQNGEAVSLEKIATAFRELLGHIPVPSMPGNVDLRLPAIIAGGTTIRTITISAVPEGQGWKISDFSAEFPGRTHVEAQGHLALGDQFGFEGNLLIASRQPSGLAGWLNADVDANIRQLSGLGLSGKVVLNDRVQQIDNLEIALEDTSLTGSFHRQISHDGVPSIDLRLQSKKISYKALKLMLSPLSGVEAMTVLGRQALNVSLKADAVGLQNTETAALDTVFRFSNGRMDFDRFMLQDLNGATIMATGNFEPHQDELSGTVDTTLLSDNLVGFIGWLHEEAPKQPIIEALYKRSQAYPNLFADSEINFVASTLLPNITKKLDSKEQQDIAADAAYSEISFSVNGKAGRMQLDFSGTAKGQWNSDEGLQVQLNGNAKSAEGEQILALLGVPVLPLGLMGELEADMTLQGALNMGVRSQLHLKAPDAAADFDGVVTVLADDVTASGKAQIKADNLEPFLASAGYSLPGFGLGLPVQFTSDVQFAKGIIRLPNLQGAVADNKISAKLEVSQLANANPLLRGEVEADELNLPTLGEIMLGAGSFSAKNNDWPQQKFVHLPLLPLSFDVKAKAAVAEAGQYGEVRDFSAKIAKIDDQLALNDVQGNWKNGQLAGEAQLRNSEGNALFSADMSWKNFDLAKVYPPDAVAGDKAPLSGKASLRAQLQGNGATISELIQSLSGSAQFVVDGLRVQQLNADHLPQMLAEADKDEMIKPQNTTKHFEMIAAHATQGGVFDVSHAQFDFTLAGGVARMGLTRLENNKAVLESDLQLDLNAMQLNGQSRFTYKTLGDMALAGGYAGVNIALSGTYAAPKAKIDYQPLVQFLTQRALVREQERVEAMQSTLREKQNLRREAEGLKALQEAREKALAETEARNKAEAQNREQEQLSQEKLREAQHKALQKINGDVHESTGNVEHIGQSVEDFLKELNQSQIQ